MMQPDGRFDRNYLIGTGSVLRFQCTRCSRVRRATQLTIWAVFLGLLGVVWLLQRVGVLN